MTNANWQVEYDGESNDYDIDRYSVTLGSWDVGLAIVRSLVQLPVGLLSTLMGNCLSVAVYNQHQGQLSLPTLRGR